MTTSSCGILLHVGGYIIFNRVDSITDLGVVMDSRMSFSALAILGFVKRLLGEFRDLYVVCAPKACVRKLCVAAFL
jgi:hypothetical protein